MGQRITQPYFKRGDDFTVVRPVRLSRDTVLQPGEDLPWGSLREFQLRSLYRRRRIGPVEHAWTKAMLELWDAKTPNRMPEVGAEVPKPYVILEPSRNAPAPAYTAATLTFVDGEGNQEGQQEVVASPERNDPVLLEEPVVPVKDGTKWLVPGHDQKFKTKKDAQAFIDAQEASSSDEDDEDAWE